MEVHLPRELEAFVRDLVATGRYASASEAFAAAVFLLQDREYVRAGRLEWLRTAAKDGFGSLEKDGPLDGEQVFAELRQKVARMRKAAPTKGARKTRRRAG